MAMVSGDTQHILAAQLVGEDGAWGHGFYPVSFKRVDLRADKS